MKTVHLFVFVLFLLLLAACQEADQSPSPSTIGEAAAPTASPPPMVTATDPTSDEQEDTAVPIPDSTTDLPAPALFDISWDDREVFRSGLIESEQGVLDDLPGASVYHLLLEIEEPTTVTGQMEVRYTNQEEVALDDIYFHLFPDQLGGSITVSDVMVNARPVQANREETALQVPLETSLEPGESIVVQMNFETTVPDGERSKYNILGFEDDILALAHFYPMIATYDDQGWHIEPSPPHGDETFADMSTYLVQVSAPAGQTVVSSGVELDRSETAAKQTMTIAAGPVRDFYLVMSDRYSVVSSNAGAVQINSYAPEELLDGAELAMDVAAQAVRSFNERYGPYPYTELDIVSTPTLALGVEYPGIFANAIRIYDLSQASSGLPNAVLLETVTTHETAHQWFYNLVGNDQLNEPWLDEAVAQYATWMYYIDRYGEQNAQGYYESLEGRWARNEFADIPIGLPADAYSGADYGAIVYGRGPIFLNELAQEMGQETFDTFLRDYGETFRWKIASTEAFQDLAEQHCACDLTSLFDESVYAN